MTITLGVTTVEGFVSRYVLSFPNGMTFMSSASCAWIGRDERQAVKDQFIQVINDLETAGFTIKGKDILDK